MTQFDPTLNDAVDGAAAVPQPILRQQVQQGNLSAMVQLLNQALEHKQITTQVRLEGKRLHLSLTAPQIPNKRVAVILTCREISAWKLGGVEMLQISGQQSNAVEPAWMQAIAISSSVEATLTLDQAVSGNLEPQIQSVPSHSIPTSTPTAPSHQISVQPIDREGWKSIAASLFLATLLLVSGQLTVLFSPFITLVHELGHTVFAWIFGYPAIPAFDFMHGGGVTFYLSGRVPLLLFVVYCGFGYLFYRYWHDRITARCLLAGVAVYTICAFTGLHQILISAMGHGFELIFAGIFLYRAISGYACRYAIERPLYGMLGFFTLFYDIRFAHSLMFDPVARELYEQGKGGILDHDFVRLAGGYLGVDLFIVAALFMVCCLVTPVGVFLVYRYRISALRMVQRLCLVDSENLT